MPPRIPEPRRAHVRISLQTHEGVPYAVSAAIRAARVRTSPSSGVLGEGRGPAGSIHSTASTSSLRRGSPLVQRATNEAMTKCVRIRAPSGKIASTWRLKAMISASIPTSSMSSLASAAASVSPTSTPPPGRENWAAGKQPVIHEQIYPAIASARARSVWEETRLQDRARQFQKTIDALCEGCAPERLPSWPGLTRLFPRIHAAPSQRQGRHCRNQERRLTERGSPAVSPFLSFVAPNRVNGRGQG